MNSHKVVSCVTLFSYKFLASHMTITLCTVPKKCWVCHYDHAVSVLIRRLRNILRGQYCQLLSTWYTRAIQMKIISLHKQHKVMAGVMSCTKF